jgi:hypothetical protein
MLVMKKINLVKLTNIIKYMFECNSYYYLVKEKKINSMVLFYLIKKYFKNYISCLKIYVLKFKILPITLDFIIFAFLKKNYYYIM